MSRAPAILLALAALVLAAGGAVHAAAFPKALAVLDTVTMPPFYLASFKALWLIDSGALIGCAILCIAVAARPSLASRATVMLFALTPATTAAIVYAFVGNFVPAHSLAAASAAILVAGWLTPARANAGQL